MKSTKQLLEKNYVTDKPSQNDQGKKKKKVKNKLKHRRYHNTWNIYYSDYNMY